MAEWRIKSNIEKIEENPSKILETRKLEWLLVIGFISNVFLLLPAWLDLNHGFFGHFWVFSMFEVFSLKFQLEISQRNRYNGSFEL